MIQKHSPHWPKLKTIGSMAIISGVVIATFGLINMITYIRTGSSVHPLIGDVRTSFNVSWILFLIGITFGWLGYGLRHLVHHDILHIQTRHKWTLKDVAPIIAAIISSLGLLLAAWIGLHK